MIKCIYDVLGWFISNFMFNFYGLAFMTLDLSSNIKALKIFHFIPVIGIAAVIFAFQMFKLVKLLPRPAT